MRWDSSESAPSKARDRVGSWQQVQIERLSGPIDGMRVHPKLGAVLICLSLSLVGRCRSGRGKGRGVIE